MADDKSLFLSYDFGEVNEALRRVFEMMSNPNLLHNWDFRNPVNQRGQSSYAEIGYTVDRWRSNMPQIVTPFADKLTVANLENNYAQISQHVENPSKYAGLTVTLSFIGNKESGDVMASIVADGQTIGVVPLASMKQLTSLTVTLPETISSHLSVNFWCNAVASTYHLYCAKLEPGSASTLSNDPPADYGEELRKCQRYYQRYKSGGSGLMIADMRNPALSSAIQGKFCLVTPMRITPSLESYSGTPTWYNATGGSVVATNVDVYAAYSDNKHLDIRFYRTYDPSQGDYGTGFLVGENAYIAFSAEL